MGEELHEVMMTAVKIVNFIKTSSLNTRWFEILCTEFGSDYRHLLMHNEVRWLSRGRFLQRLFELRAEVQEFLAQKKSLLASHLADSDWLTRLAYFVDLFNELNIVNLSLQGKDSNVFRNMDKIHAFMMKLQH